MRISSVRIQNFRGFEDQTVCLNDYTCLVGPNGCGKSTVLTALNVFFQETSHARTNLTKLEKEDFHLVDGAHNTSEPVRITVTFEDLDAAAQDDLKDYVRQGKLVVSAVAAWNEDDGYAQVVQYGQRLGIESFKPFFRALSDGASVKELKEIYVTLRERWGDLPAPGTKAAMVEALHNYESAHPAECTLIPSEDQFYGFSKGVNRLGNYIQWVFVPAVKDASDEQVESSNSILGKLLERTVRSRVSFKEPLETLQREAGEKYQQIVNGQQYVLESLSASLTNRLETWIHPGVAVSLQWMHDPDKSVRVAEPVAQFVAGERSFKGKLARLGHGYQRSFILAILEELASSETGDSPKLLLACEEPELYQHPPQARHIAAVMQQLTTRNTQVVVCTHSPYFVSGRLVEDVRSIRMNGTHNRSECRSVTLESIAKTIADAHGERPTTSTGMLLKIEQALQPVLSEIFFADLLVLVEGIEDAAYITAHLTLNELCDEFRRCRCHIVPVGGKSSLKQPIAIAKHLGIPCFVAFDSDGHRDAPDPTDEKKKADDKRGRRMRHFHDNTAILKLMGVEEPNPFPSETLWRDNLVMWKSEIGEIVVEDIGKAELSRIAEKVRTERNIIDGDLDKKVLFIGYKLAEAQTQGKISASLQRLCRAIIAFAEQQQGLTAADGRSAVALSN